VLPFLNFSTDPAASEHLSDGIAEDLINALAQTDSLDVAARTSSFQFRNKDLSVRTIGDSLHVALVVEGSVRQEGDRLRVTAQLIKVADGYHLWSHTFDRQLKDVLSLQQEIANAMVDALRIRLASAERTRLADGGTTNTQAYQLFLRGRYLLQKATRPAVLDAIAYLDSAAAQDPRYALAFAELAQAHVLAAATGDLPHQEALDTAKSAAEQAIRLAPTLSEAHAASGRAELERWNWTAAEREAKLAVQLNPKNASAHTIYTRVLMVLGQPDAAVREGALAAELEPFSAAAADNYAEALRGARKFDQAVQAHRKALQLEPNLGRQNLAKAYIELGNYDSALAQFRGALAAGAPHLPRIDLLWTAYTYARAGKRDQARALLRQFTEGGEPRRPNYLLAATYLALGDNERVFPLLESGVAERSQAAWRQLPWDPIWDPIRRDPRFVRVLRQMNLP
jgi:TolB-like protein/Tfp pilus assembly protein PilF